MKIKFTILGLLLILFPFIGFSQLSNTYVVTETLHFPSTGGSYGKAFPVSATSFYTMGEFSGTMDFDPTAATMNLTSTNDTDAFIAKYSDNNVVKWAHAFEAAPGSILQVLDGETDTDGNLTVVGIFTGSIDLAISNDVVKLIETDNGEMNGFVARFDTFGNLLWGFAIGNNCGGCGPKEEVSFVTVDKFGNALVGGQFHGTVDFNPDGIPFFLTSNGGLDFFIARYDEFGDLMSARSFGGLQEDYLTGLATNRDNEIFITGGFMDEIVFDVSSSDGTFISQGGTDHFLVKLNSAFEFLWGFCGGNEKDDMFKNVQVDSDGNVYTACTIDGTVDFDPTDAAFNLSSVNMNDAVILKYSPMGTLIWALAYDAPGIDDASIGFIDELNNPVFSLDFELGDFDLDPGLGYYPVNDMDGLQTICRINPDGNLKQALMYAFSPDGNVDITTREHKNNTTFISLTLEGTADVDPTGEVELVTSTSFTSDFVIIQVKADALVLPVDWTRFTATPNWGGVILEWETAREIDNAGFEVQRSKDGVHWNGLDFIPGQNTNTNIASRYSYFDEHPYEGNNYYRLKQIDLNGEHDYSHIEEVYFKGNAENYHFGVFPNPVRETAQVNLSIPDAEPGTPVRLYSLQGQLLNQFTFSGENTLVDLGALPAGHYMLTAEVGNELMTKRLIVK